jgi:transcriptional regulator with XRE-family HTH domain
MAANTGRLTPDKAEEVLARIEAGESQREIANSLQVAQSLLNAWLNSDDMADRFARAKEASAEAWLDRGAQYLLDAKSKDSPYDVQAARALAQECARRAAIRNPKYNDRVRLEHSGRIQTSDTLTNAELVAIAAKGK